ncbi:MAG TPA: hypothetical protein PKC13_12765, partial [Blastocatellia bacterium]|nr:hypothetical protein [Blastocatellia bacterium]
NGLRSRANNFTVDGSDNNDEDIGVRRQGFLSLVPQPLESIREYQAITLLAPAQFGRNFGANVNAVSKSGGNQVHGNLYGFFNSSQLNARNPFDTANGNSLVPVTAGNGRAVFLDGQQLQVRNNSGGEDSFTLGKVGGTLGGPILRQKTFYFLAAEGQLINSAKEENFAVPTVEQRGVFNSGATGVVGNPLGTGFAGRTRPTNAGGNLFFSLFPFANNPTGVYGANTYTQVLPANARGVVASAKIDHNFNLAGRTQSMSGRYNYTDDKREVPKTGEAIFSTLEPKVRAQNFSYVFNSQLTASGSRNQAFNQVRFSYGRTRLRFVEVKPCPATDAAYSNDCLLASDRAPNTPFLINRRSIENLTVPAAPTTALTGEAQQQQPQVVNYRTVVFNRRPIHTEEDLGLLGQLQIAGFNPLGVDVTNFPQTRVNNTYQLADVLTWRVGDHAMAFGTDIRRSELNSNLPRITRPYVTFNGTPPALLNSFFKPQDLAAMGVPSNFFLTLANTGNTPAAAAADLSLRFYQYNFFGQDDWRILPNLSVAYGLRYEANTAPREINNRIERTFNDPALGLIPGLRTFIQGREKIFETDRNNFAPRVSLAYSPNIFGKDRTTVFRGGFGVFFDQVLGAVVSQSRNVYPTFLTLNFGGLFADREEVLLSYVNPAATSIQGIPLVRGVNQLNLPLNAALIQILNQNFPPAFGATVPNPRLDTPNAFHYTFAFEQQLSRQLTFSFAYVGTNGRKLLRFTTPNLGPGTNILPTSFAAEGDEPLVFGRVCIPFIGTVRQPVASLSQQQQQVCGRRPVPDIGAVNVFTTTGTSRYDSFQFELRGRFFQSLQLQASYVFSASRDDVSEAFDLAGASALPQNSRSFAGERAASNFDLPNRGTLAAIYDADNLKDKLSKMGWLLGGMQISAIGRIQSGQPFTVNSVYDVNLDGNLTDRLNSTNGLQMTGDGRQPIVVQTANLGSLLAATGRDGQIERNSFRAGGLAVFDLAVSKAFSFSGTKRIRIRADFFNLFNRANYAIPVRTLEAPGFGRAINTLTPGFRLQLGLKFEF